MPRRIQRKRTKGWRMPDGAVYVGRPTRWGNPYTVNGSWVEGPRYSSYSTDLAGRHAEAVRLFRGALLSGNLRVSVEDVRRELRGKDLACWCPLGRECHADVLIDVANNDEVLAETIAKVIEPALRGRAKGGEHV